MIQWITKISCVPIASHYIVHYTILYQLNNINQAVLLTDSNKYACLLYAAISMVPTMGPIVHTLYSAIMWRGEIFDVVLP